jgi:hypothetical protein
MKGMFHWVKGMFGWVKAILDLMIPAKRMVGVVNAANPQLQAGFSIGVSLSMAERHVQAGSAGYYSAGYYIYGMSGLD